MSAVIVERQGAVATLRMNRPERMNVYDFEMGEALLASLRRCRKPVIAAVNGVAAGGGFSLALAGDIVVAAESARFMLAYQNIGLSPDGGATFFLARTVGTHRAMELSLSGRTLSAGEAASWGLVQRVFPDASFPFDTAALAAGIAAGPTLAYGKAKELHNRALHQPLETQMEEERQGIAKSARTGDFREGVRAFLAKEKASFQGK